MRMSPKGVGHLVLVGGAILQKLGEFDFVKGSMCLKASFESLQPCPISSSLSLLLDVISDVPAPGAMSPCHGQTLMSLKL